MGNAVVKEESNEEPSIFQPSRNDLTDLSSDGCQLGDCNIQINDFNRNKHLFQWSSESHETDSSSHLTEHTELRSPDNLSLQWSANMLNQSIQNRMSEQIRKKSETSQQSVSKQIQQNSEIFQYCMSGVHEGQMCGGTQQDMSKLGEESSKNIQSVTNMIKEGSWHIQHVPKMIKENSENIQCDVVKIVEETIDNILHEVVKIVEESKISITRGVVNSVEKDNESLEHDISKIIKERSESIEHDRKITEESGESIECGAIKITEEDSKSVEHDATKIIEKNGERIEHNIRKIVQESSESMQYDLTKIAEENAERKRHDISTIVEDISESILLDVAQVVENSKCVLHNVTKLVGETNENVDYHLPVDKKDTASIQKNLCEQREPNIHNTEPSPLEHTDGNCKFGVKVNNFHRTTDLSKTQIKNSQSCINSFGEVKDISLNQSTGEKLNVNLAIGNNDINLSDSVANVTSLCADKKEVIGFLEEVRKHNAVASFECNGEKYSAFIPKSKIEYEGRKIGMKLFADDLLIPKQQMTLHFNTDFKYNKGALVVSRAVINSKYVNTEEMLKANCFVFPPYTAVLNNKSSSHSLQGTVESAFDMWGTLSFSINRKQKRAIFLRENVYINTCNIPDQTKLNLVVDQGMPVTIDVNHNESSAKILLMWYFGQIAYLTRNGGIIIFKKSTFEEKAVFLLENLYINKKRCTTNDLKDTINVGDRVAFLTKPSVMPCATLQATYLLFDNQQKSICEIISAPLNTFCYIINLLSISQKTINSSIQGVNDKKLHFSWNQRDPLIDFLRLKESCVNFKQASASIMKSIGHFKKMKCSLKQCKNNYYYLLDILGTALIFGGLMWKEYIHEVFGSKDSVDVDLSKLRITDVSGKVLEERILMVGVRKVLFHPNDVYINGERCSKVERGSVFHCTITELPHPGSFGETHFAWCLWQGIRPDVRTAFSIFENKKIEAVTLKENHWYVGHVVALYPPQTALVSLCAEGKTVPVVVFDSFIENKKSIFSQHDGHWIIDFINIGESLSVMLLRDHYKAVRAKRSCNFEASRVCLQEKLNYVQGNVCFLCNSFGIVKFSSDGSWHYGVILNDHVLIDGKKINSSISSSTTLKFGSFVMFCQDFINSFTENIHYIPALYVCTESTQQKLQHNTDTCFKAENDNEDSDIDVGYLNGVAGVLIDINDDYGLLQCGMHKAVFHKSNLFLSGKKHDQSKTLPDVIHKGMTFYVVAVQTLAILFGLQTTHVCTCVWNSERPTIATIFESFISNTAYNSILKQNVVYYGTVAELAPPSVAIVSVKIGGKQIPVLLFATSLTVAAEKVKSLKTVWINDYLVPGDILRIKISRELKNLKFLVANEGCKTNNIVVMTVPEKCNVLEIFPGIEDSDSPTLKLKANNIQTKTIEEILENETTLLNDSLPTNNSATSKLNVTSERQVFDDNRNCKSGVADLSVGGNNRSKKLTKKNKPVFLPVDQIVIKPGSIYYARVTEVKRYSFICEVEASNGITPIFVRNISFFPTLEMGHLGSRESVTLHVNVGDVVYVKLKCEKVGNIEWSAKRAWKETVESRTTDLNAQKIKQNVILGEKGQITELTPEQGQLKTLSNHIIKFLKENVYLYGVPLGEFNLTEVLAVGDTVSFSIVDQQTNNHRVWIGSCEVTSFSETYRAVTDHCSKKRVKYPVIEKLMKILCKYRPTKSGNKSNKSPEVGESLPECVKTNDNLGNTSAAEEFLQNRDFIPVAASMSNSKNVKPQFDTEEIVQSSVPGNTTSASVLQNMSNAPDIKNETLTGNSDSDCALVLNTNVRNILELSLNEVLYSRNYTSNVTEFSTYVLNSLENTVKTELFKKLLPSAVSDAVNHFAFDNNQMVQTQNVDEISELASRIADIWGTRSKTLLDNFKFLNDDTSVRNESATPQGIDEDSDLMKGIGTKSDNICIVNGNTSQNRPSVVDSGSQTVSTGNILYLKLYSNDDDVVT